MDSGKLNIPSTITDPNYRYKMPKLAVVSQGSGGGVKTKLENIIDVAKALQVPPDFKNNFYLLNGTHTQENLQKILDRFIQKFLLCVACKLPETRIYVKKSDKNSDIKTKCKACGKTARIDDKEKLSSHIKRNPPKYDEETDKKVDKPKKPDEVEKVDTAKLNKEIMKRIKEALKSISEKISKLENVEEITPILNDYFNENVFDVDQKYIILVNSLWDKNIYGHFRTKAPIIKHFLDKEPNQEEAMYHFIIAIIDFIYNKCKSENLGKYVSSIVYLAYEIEIITEDFFTKYALTNMRYMPLKQSLFGNQEFEEKFFNDTIDFKNWLSTAPYEDEEDTRNTSTKPNSKLKVEVAKKEEVKEVEEIEEKPSEPETQTKKLDEVDIDNI